MTTMLTLVCTIASAACAAVTVILSVRNMRPEPFFIINGRVEARAYADWMIVVVNIGVGDMCDVRVSTPTKPDRVLVAACIRPGERYDMTATLPGKRIDPNRMRLDEIARSEYGSFTLHWRNRLGFRLSRTVMIRGIERETGRPVDRQGFPIRA